MNTHTVLKNTAVKPFECVLNAVRPQLPGADSLLNQFGLGLSFTPEACDERAKLKGGNKRGVLDQTLTSDTPG